MKRTLLVICLIVLATVTVVTIASRLRPTILTVSVDGARWNHISVRSSNFTGTKVFDYPSPAVVTPIRHGSYTVGVEYADGSCVWTKFFHYDAGKRKRIDLFFDGTPQTQPITVKEVSNGNEILFKGQTTPDKATLDRPYTLDWF